MAAYRKSNDIMKMTKIIKKLPYDTDLLEEIARTAPMEGVRKEARERLNAIHRRKAYYASHDVPVCSVCGKPLITAPFFTAKQSCVVTGRSWNYRGGRSTTTTAYNVAYSELERHTGTYCEYCQQYKSGRSVLIGTIVMFGGIALAIARIIIDEIRNVKDINTLLFAIIGTIIAVIGYGVVTANGGFGKGFPDRNYLPPIPSETVYGAGTAEDDASIRLVELARNFNSAKISYDEPIPRDRVLLSTPFVRDHVK